MNLRKVHKQAMEFAQEAMFLREIGKEQEALEFFRKAFEAEKKAAYLLFDKFDNEPTRGVLFRSAASLALDCNEIAEAERLVSQGLAGTPPKDIADELRNLYENINLQRHLEIEDITLSPTELQMSLSGNEVGFGFISSEEFLGRYKKFELLTYRTAERLAGREFRTGKIKAGFKVNYQTYLSVPRAASFAVTIRLGKSPNVQLDFFQGNPIEKVIDDIISNFNLINEGKEEELKKHIGNEKYFQNFISLTKAIAPDGDRVRQVGFTTSKNGSNVSVGFTRSNKSIKNYGSEKDSATETLIIEGTLEVADARKNIISITEANTNKKYNISVPDGLDDIVKEFWELDVKAIVLKKGNKFQLSGIEKKDN